MRIFLNYKFLRKSEKKQNQHLTFTLYYLCLSSQVLFLYTQLSDFLFFVIFSPNSSIFSENSKFLILPYIKKFLKKFEILCRLNGFCHCYAVRVHTCSPTQIISNGNEKMSNYVSNTFSIVFEKAAINDKVHSWWGDVRAID